MNIKKVTPLLVLAGAAGVLLASCGAPKCATKKYSGEETCETDTSVEGKGATGAFQYIGADYDERTEILGKLEKYAVDHSITGLPIFENSGKVMYSPTLTKGTENYIPGYGFSNLRDGQTNADLPGETVDKYKRYLHTYETENPGTVNYLNSDNSLVGDLYGNASTGLFGNKVNADKTGYDWYGVLSIDDKPRPVVDGVAKKVEDTTPGELHTKWRVHVRTGEEGGVKYRTASTKADRAAFNNRAVALDDYVEAFKILLTQKNGYYRGAELAGQSGKYGFVGASKYYQSSANGFNETAWAGVGIKSGTDAEGDYLDFEFLAPTNRFYAMYSLASSLYQPVPHEFFELVGAETYGGNSKDLSTGPVDNILSLGPYYLDTWGDQLMTWARNDDWFEIKENSSLYRIPGIHTAVLKGQQTDDTTALQEFLAGKLHSVGIPSSKLNEYKNDARTVTVPGDTVWKLNINATTPELWEQLFGVNGEQTSTPKDKYWNVKPWMSNESFLKGMFFSIDRKTFAENRGSDPAINYFSDDYLINPEEGISYNSTKAHEDALKSFWGDTVSTNGYSPEASELYFKKAIEELYACGKINNCSKLTIEIWWMSEAQIKSMGSLIKQYIESSFNKAAKDLGYKDMKLKVNNNAVVSALDVYYDHLMVGQFDLGLGSINGNPLDPLNFMEVLKSSNSSGFTLNWGSDTTFVDGGENRLEYDGKLWSFDTLFDAADRGALLVDGKAAPAAKLAIPDDGVQYAEEYNSVVLTLQIKPVTALYPDLDWTSVKVNVEEAYVYDGARGTVLYVEPVAQQVLEDGTIVLTFALDAIDSLTVIETLKGFVFEAGISYTVDGFSGSEPAYPYLAGVAPKITDAQLEALKAAAEEEEDLLATVAKAQALLKSTDPLDYVEEDRPAIESALTALETTLDDEEGTLDELKAAIKALEDVLAEAREIPAEGEEGGEESGFRTLGGFNNVDLVA